MYLDFFGTTALLLTYSVFSNSVILWFTPLRYTVPQIFTIPSLLFINQQNPKIPCCVLILNLATLQVSYKSQVLS